MNYTIGQVAKKMGLTSYTLRYYDKEGLLPFVKKSASGLRIFSEQDIDWLVIIECLKDTGMPLKNIKLYIDWYIEGDSTLEKRLEMFKQQKEKVEKQMQLLQKHKLKIEYKIDYYNKAVAAGKTDSHEIKQCLEKEKKRLSKKL